MILIRQLQKQYVRVYKGKSKRILYSNPPLILFSQAEKNKPNIFNQFISESKWMFWPSEWKWMRLTGGKKNHSKVDIRLFVEPDAI